MERKKENFVYKIKMAIELKVASRLNKDETTTEVK
jgi:hypothetical protein